MAFASPDEIIKELSIEEGAHVADFGAGSGVYTLVAAKLAGGSGRVYAVDVQKDMLTKVKNEASQQGFGGVEVIWGNIEDPQGSHLSSRSVDRLILSNTLFQAENREAVVKEAARVLKPNGLLLFVDWSGSYGGMGPAQEQVLLPAVARKLFLNNGFAEVKPVETGQYHYGIIFRRL